MVLVQFGQLWNQVEVDSKGLVQAEFEFQCQVEIEHDLVEVHDQFGLECVVRVKVSFVAQVLVDLGLLVQIQSELEFHMNKVWLDNFNKRHDFKRDAQRGMMLRGFKYDAPKSEHELGLEYLALETLMGGSSIVLMDVGCSESEI